MNFIMILALKYVLFTAMMFLMGVFMYCLFEDEMEYMVISKQNKAGEDIGKI